jgi:hypothetical protein
MLCALPITHKPCFHHPLPSHISGTDFSMAPALGNRHASQDSSQETCQTPVANRAADVTMTQGLLIVQFSQESRAPGFSSSLTSLSDAAQSRPNSHQQPAKPSSWPKPNLLETRQSPVGSISSSSAPSSPFRRLAPTRRSRETVGRQAAGWPVPRRNTSPTHCPPRQIQRPRAPRIT